jgi:AraC-like DNA-binding protein
VIAEAFCQSVHRYSAWTQTHASLVINDLTCAVASGAYSGTSRLNVFSDRHVFAVTLDGTRSEVVEETWDGIRGESRVVSAVGEALLVPRGQRYSARFRGHASTRYLVFEFEHVAFARLLGLRTSDIVLRSHSGPNPIASGIVERLEALALTPQAFPCAYADALTSMLVVELWRAFGTDTCRLTAENENGTSRFQRVLDFIDQNLENELSLEALALLVDLSRARFAHAFKAEFSVAPYQYILQRRIEAAKKLLRTTEDTVGAIASRVGFSSQGRLTQAFVRATGLTPSAYRASARPCVQRVG